MEDANLLLTSDTLTELGYKTLVPDPILLKKGFIRVRSEHSVSDIVYNMDERERSLVRSASRRFSRDGRTPTDIIDFLFVSTRIPRSTFIFDVEHFITPIILPPKRCFY